MFTWNFQYISKARLAEVFNQLMLNSQKGDILVRIHTSIHSGDEAVDLARFIKQNIPGAYIYGTSASAVIGWGKYLPNQCIISVTQMERGKVKTAMLPIMSGDDTLYLADEMCHMVKDAVISDDTKLLLTFVSGWYSEVSRFVDKSNQVFPGIRMIGGIANKPDPSSPLLVTHGFVFDENSWSERSIFVASISGEEVEAMASCATGAQPVGPRQFITETSDINILKIDGKNAADVYLDGTGEAVKKDPQITGLLPYVYSDSDDVPLFVNYDRDRHLLWAFNRIDENREIRRGFIYTGKIIADDRAMFMQVENFKKSEMILAYSCSLRYGLYPNSVRWELSVYENSNMFGCVTNGEISNVRGKNVYMNSSFVMAVTGENEASQEFNPFVFAYTDELNQDDQGILTYIAGLQEEYGNETENMPEGLASLLQDYKNKLLYSGGEEYANAAALNMDIKTKGYDRVCMISVSDISNMRAVFSEDVIELTYHNYTKKCAAFARAKKYRFYVLNGWDVAIGATSYMVSLPQFLLDMEELQKNLFEATEDFIAIVPQFCLIDDCNVDNIYDTYRSSKVEMAQKNIQFMLTKAEMNALDTEKLRERYRMVNVINYAIAHDKVIPYYQGIYDNKEKRIHHYEALMRLMDESGNILAPGAFLDVARTYGLLYDSISMIMIKKVFKKFESINDVSVSVNLGFRDIKNHELVQYIYDFLRSSEHPENFIFEILENEDVDDYEYLINFVDKIHDLGAKIAIDDFGSGFSNLQHILSIELDYLKIDGSIIKRCCDNPESERLISLIASWRHLGSHKFRIIAEFVENEEIQKIIKKYRVDYSQGYYFSKPSPDLDVRG